MCSHRVTSHHITSHHITSHHITSYHIISHHITSRHITSHLLRFERSHRNLKSGIDSVDATADVSTFSKLYGADMPFELPVQVCYRVWLAWLHEGCDYQYRFKTAILHHICCRQQADVGSGGANLAVKVPTHTTSKHQLYHIITHRISQPHRRRARFAAAPQPCVRCCFNRIIIIIIIMIIIIIHACLQTDHCHRSQMSTARAATMHAPAAAPGESQRAYVMSQRMAAFDAFNHM